MNEYTDKFTADGRLNPRNFGPVTKIKVKAIRELFNAGMRGDRVAAAKFAESISTSDAIFSAAYITNLQVLDQFDKAPRTWSQIAGVRELPDFRPAVLTGLFGGFEGLERQGADAGNGQENPAGIPPVVAEAESYPYATIGSVEASYGRLKKRGFKVGWSWEAQVNDAIDFFAQIPGEMIQTALDAEEWEVYQALLSTGTARQLAAVTAGNAYDGVAVAINSPLSKGALVAAVQQIAARTVNGRNIQVNGGYNLIVPIGRGLGAQIILSGQIIQQVPASGGYLSAISDPTQNLLNTITVVESQFVTGTNWYLLPAPGAVRRPVLELGRLRGNAAPELRVDNATGNYNGGASISPFEGNFSHDTVDLRLRYALTGVLWSDAYILWSKGTGAA